MEKFWRRAGRGGRADRAARVALVPGEDVLLLSVALPPMPAAQRRSAVAFAVEDRIARPLEEVHVVLGPPLAGGRWLVAVVGRAVLAGHLARLRPDVGVRVLPDTLTLAVPPEGHWSARADGPRILLRMADGTGMVVAADRLDLLRAVAGQPAMLWQGIARPGEGQDPSAPLPIGPDLRSATADGSIAGFPRLARRLAAVAVVAIAISLGLLGAETVVLSQQVDARKAALRRTMAEAGLSEDGDPATLLARAIAERRGEGRAMGFLPLMTTAMAAMGPLTGQAALRDLHYAGDTLAMTVQAPDLATLQAIGAALTDATLRIEAGAAAQSDGLAEQTLTVAR